MSAPSQDLTTTQFVLPPDTKLIATDELSPRLRAKIGPVRANDVVITRPGFRVTTRLISETFADLLREFRNASLLTEAVARFSRSRKQNAEDILELSFDALATLIEGRILVAADSPDVKATEPSLAAGQAVTNIEIMHLVRALDDTEVYRARMPDGAIAALKIARDHRAANMLTHEARLLSQLDGDSTPRLLAKGNHKGRFWLSMEWRIGVPVAVAAQQLRASGERARLHKLIIRLLEAYAKLHEKGIIHGDIHPSNILAADDDTITILDFGRAARTTEPSEANPERAGIAYFYDPQMAIALLAGMVPPAPSTVAEQYALGVLVYLLLTGLYPVEPAAEHSELLTRIVTRPPLPFAARGVDASPRVESVLHQALAKEEKARFTNTSDFALALRKAGTPRCRQIHGYACVERMIESLRKGESLPGRQSPPHLAWVSLRAALARSDPELLAVASYWASQEKAELQAAAIACHVAFAQSNRLAVQDASQVFISAASKLKDDESRCQALLEAAALLEHSVSFKLDHVKEWTTALLGEIWETAARPASMVHAALALARTGTVALPAGTYEELERIKLGSAWLWGDAYDQWQQASHAKRASAAELPRDRLMRGLTLLRLHQVTGDMRWVGKARRIATQQLRNTTNVFCALLAIELEMPARARPMPLWQAEPTRSQKPLKSSCSA